MSTKKTREALAMLGVVAGGSGVMRQALDDALKEIEAIERAALEFSRADQIPSALQRAYDLMRSIAREAK